MSTPLTVAVVDDQALMRTGFAMIVDAEPDLTVVGEAANGTDGVTLCRTHRPDVVLMDIRMPDGDGIEATRALVADENLDTRVLILTTFDLDEYVYEAVRAGASGFLLKDTRPEDLVAAIRVIAAGDALLSPSVTKQLLAAFVRQPEPSAAAAAHLETLTEREREVLLNMAGGLSNAEIAEALILGETTVKTHVSRVLMKLGVRDRVQAVVAAYECGLVQPSR